MQEKTYKGWIDGTTWFDFVGTIDSNTYAENRAYAKRIGLCLKSPTTEELFMAICAHMKPEFKTPLSEDAEIETPGDTVQNLETLKNALENGTVTAPLDALPTFGGVEPTCTLGILSWDEYRLLLADDYTIVYRVDWFNLPTTREELSAAITGDHTAKDVHALVRQIPDYVKLHMSLAPQQHHHYPTLHAVYEIGDLDAGTLPRDLDLWVDLLRQELPSWARWGEPDAAIVWDKGCEAHQGSWAGLLRELSPHQVTEFEDFIFLWT